MSGITRPLSHRPRKLHTTIILVTIWTVSLTFAAPLTMFYTYGIVRQDEEETPFCFVSQEPTILLLYSVYNCISVSVQYLIPLIVISYTYLKICARLWWSVTPGKDNLIRQRT